MRTVLEKSQPRNKEVDSPLTRLLSGRSVTLSVNDPRIMRKKRTGNTVLLHIAPFPSSEEGKQCFLFAMPGYGAEIMCSGSFNVATLIRVGLTAKSAKVLVSELSRLF